MTEVTIPLALAQAAYRMAYKVEDIAIILGDFDSVVEAASAASDLLDVISDQAGPLAAEEARPTARRGIQPPLGN